MNNNARSNVWKLSKELKRRCYWARKNKKKSQVLEAKLNNIVTKHELILEQQYTLLLNDLKNSHIVIQDLIDSNKKCDFIIETCEGIIMDLMRKAKQNPVCENLVRENPIREIVVCENPGCENQDRENSVHENLVRENQNLDLKHPVHEHPVHEFHQDSKLSKEQEFMLIPIHEKQQVHFHSWQFFGLNSHKRKCAGILFSKRKKVRTKY